MAHRRVAHDPDMVCERRASDRLKAVTVDHRRSVQASRCVIEADLGSDTANCGRDLSNGDEMTHVNDL
jgi:hypothetical protein